MKKSVKIKKKTIILINPFKILPNDVLIKDILTYLEENKILEIGLTNKDISTLCNNILLWKELSHRKFGKDRLKKLNAFINDLKKEKLWKEIFKRLIKISRDTQKDFYSYYRYFFLFNSKNNENFEKVLKIKFHPSCIKEISNLKYETYKECIQIFQKLTHQRLDLTDNPEKNFYYVGELVDNNFFNYEIPIFGSVFKENGVMIYKGFFLNGKMNGIGTSYYESGKKKCEGFWKDNFFIDGTRFSQGDLDLIFIGKWNLYNSSHDQTRRNNYLNLNFEGVVANLKNGNLLMEGQWIDGKNNEYPDKRFFFSHLCLECKSSPILGKCYEEKRKNQFDHPYFYCEKCFQKSNLQPKNFYILQ